jgi:hypothetical protein
MANFFDTLMSMRQDPQAINQQFGVPNQDVNLARAGALQNLSLQLLAMGQEMTPDARARMMANLKSPIGGYMDSLNSARQNQMLKTKMQQEQQEQMRATLGRQELEQQIRTKMEANPADPYARRALGLMAAGDVVGAAKALNPEPQTPSYKMDSERGIYYSDTPGAPILDLQGRPIGGGQQPMQPQPQPGAGQMPQQPMQQQAMTGQQPMQGQMGGRPIGPNGLPMTPKEIADAEKLRLEEQGRLKSMQSEYEVANQAAKEIDKAVGLIDNDRGVEAFGYQIPGLNMPPSGPMATNLANSIVGPILAPDATKMKTYLEGIASKTGLKKLLEMKSASPTGASGFGALSGPELTLLQNSYANILQAQDPKDLRENLMTVRRLLLKAATPVNQGGKGSMMQFDAEGNLIQ